MAKSTADIDTAGSRRSKETDRKEAHLKDVMRAKIAVSEAAQRLVEAQAAARSAGLSAPEIAHALLMADS